MNKLLAVFKREYLQAVRKKMFIVMTLLFPVIVGGAILIPSLIMARGLEGKRVAVLDATGTLREAFDPQALREAKAEEKKDAQESPLRNRRRPELPMEIQYVDAKGVADLDAAAKPYLERMAVEDKSQRLSGVFLVPAGVIEGGEDVRMKYYSRSATDFITQERLSRQTNRAVQRERLTARGVNPAELDEVLEDVGVDAIQLSKTGEQRTGGEANFILGFILTGLVILPAFVYGLEIMRGIIQEKTDRVVEVLISSMEPMHLLVGKILGVAAVGLTQIAVWLAMAGVAAAYGATMAAAAGVNVLSMLRPSIFLYFVIFFVLAYLTYVCIYAIGGAVCNSEKEAQQLVAPVTMLMMLPWFLLIAIITNPDSGMSVGLSLMPIFGPVTMYVRTLVSEPPIWHILLSIAISIATIAVFFWATAKIFRVGILSYGKRPTIPELWRWLKVA